MGNKSETSSQAISLPKGGGAIKGIGETFQPNLFTGTGNYSIPIATSPGRSGFGPKLSLQYSTGNGNGPFGLGWQLSIPRITCKTEKGLPKYDESDVFVMSGAEDLVPCLKKVVDPASGQENWEHEDPVDRPPYTITRYRPRTEGLFARIEKWVHSTTGDVHWRATTKENITSIYGRTPEARITDPEIEKARLSDSKLPSHVYEWLLQETLDAKGNHILYEYAREEPDLSRNLIYEKNRRYQSQFYIRRIYYGNVPDSLPESERKGPKRWGIDHDNHLSLRERYYLFEVLFDYGDPKKPSDDPYSAAPSDQELTTDDWFFREDPFSSYRAGFEIRTLRRCRRVLMFHHFKELNGTALVRSTDFDYENDQSTRLSLLSSVRVKGYVKRGGTYESAEMPPVEFKYSTFRPYEQRYHSIEARGNNLPSRSLRDPNFALVDLFGDGLPDVLETIPGGYRYWRNLGNGRLDHTHPQHGLIPSVALSQPGVAFGDIAGDGMADLLVQAPPLAGFFEATPDGGWKPFKRFEKFPSVSLSDPSIRLVDLTGDGRTDALMTADHHFLWFECLGEEGYGQAQVVQRKHNLDEFPDVYFNDPSGRVRLADMTGDGLNDIVLVHNGRIDYWPNLGYGKFGKRITMENAPHLELNFDPKRLFLTDLDGSGCADLVYVDFNRVHFWFNQSGNHWSDPQTIHGTPVVTDLDSIQFADVFGTGTTTLFWSYDYNFQPGGNYKALDFCGGVKPYLLIEMSNNMGATTKVSYAPSTRYFLEDEANGTPWATKLPFPVQVVEKVEVIDHIGKTKLVTTYKYHHGYYDGREREFRGFGRVDQFDTETFEDFTGSCLHDGRDVFDNNKKAYHVPPVETRTWFHTGIYFDEDRPASNGNSFDFKELAKEYRKEFYDKDGQAFELEDHVVEKDRTPHEAYRALRGSVLRTEVYGRDRTGNAEHPYLVTENRYQVKLLQPKNGNNHAVYLTTKQETLSYHYERNPADPRISHEITLNVDDFGNITDSVSIGYPRRLVPAELPEQGTLKIVYTKSDYVNKVTDNLFYYVGIPYQKRSYEITGINWSWTGSRQRLTEAAFDAITAHSDSFRPYEWDRDATFLGEAKRIIEWTRTYFRKNTAAGTLDISLNPSGNPVRSLDNRLALGEIESRGLPYENYQAAFTEELLTKVYSNEPIGGDLRVPAETMVRGGYHKESDQPTYWWIPSGQQTFNEDQFYLPEKSSDPFGNVSEVHYDDYGLLIKKTLDPLENKVEARSNYRVLQPDYVTDPNGNRSAVRFDALGLVVMTFIMAKHGKNEGDRFDDTSTEISIEDDPTTCLEYDLFARLAFVKTSAREKHRDPNTRWQISYNYSDGFGREIQKKIQAEPERRRDDTFGPPRWVGSGWTIFNNKGKPVEKYEPFFDDTHNFHFGRKVGVSPTLFYDPLERVVATIHPNHTYEKVVFDPWKQANWDSNDTVLLDPRTDTDISGYVKAYLQFYDAQYRLDHEGSDPKTWYRERINDSSRPAERKAAKKTEAHAGTPTVAHLDTLGRTFLTVANNGKNASGHDVRFETRLELDIEGNDLQITDPRGIQAFTHRFDIAGRKLSIDSTDAGLRLTLPDVAGKPIYNWDANGNRVRTEYDELRRPTEVWVKPRGDDEYLAEKTIYGESASESAPSQDKNHRGRVWKICDGAGLAINDEYDFKGNLKKTRRRLLKNPRPQARWSKPDSTAFDDSYAESLLESGSGYTILSEYDALNRITRNMAPNSSITFPVYNEANLLNSVKVQIRDGETKVLVKDIDYNEKGQRTSIIYGNKVRTVYTYDPDTFRLTRLTTTRKYDITPEIIQDLQYTYDPVGNITHIKDDAIPTIWYDQTEIDAVSDYTYDPIYRLTLATGREHKAIGFNYSREETAFKQSHFIPLPPPTTDAQALQMYTEAYWYDPGGNLERISHYRGVATDPATLAGAAPLWTRNQVFESGSNRITFSRPSNDLPSSTGVPDLKHDANGNLVKIDDKLHDLQWDYKNQLIEAELNAAGNKAYYQSDAAGQRVRKFIIKNGMTEEHLCLGSYEIYRKSNGSGTQLERHTLHVMDDKKRIALVETKNPGTLNKSPRVRYQLGNHLGSSVLEVDDTSNANIISYEEYYPYGETSFIAGKKQQEVSAKRYRYSGKERDDETGLYYYGARYYAPWLGRWVSCDPAGTIDGTNLYAYARNSPIVLRDPTGYQAVGDIVSEDGKQYRIARIDQVEHSTTKHAEGGISRGWGYRVQREQINNTSESQPRSLLDDLLPKIKEFGGWLGENLGKLKREIHSELRVIEGRANAWLTASRLVKEFERSHFQQFHQARIAAQHRYWEEKRRELGESYARDLKMPVDPQHNLTFHQRLSMIAALQASGSDEFIRDWRIINEIVVRADRNVQMEKERRVRRSLELNGPVGEFLRRTPLARVESFAISFIASLYPTSDKERAEAQKWEAAGIGLAAMFGVSKGETEGLSGKQVAQGIAQCQLWGEEPDANLRRRAQAAQ